MQKNVKENIQKLIYEQKNQTMTNLQNEINKAYKDIIKNNNYLSREDLEHLLKNILSIISTEIEKLLSDCIVTIKEDNNISTDEINNKKEYKIESNSELNIFTSKDIQEENKEITRNFQNETYNYMNINENTENENVANFLAKVAEVSRISYNSSLKLLKDMEEKFIKKKGYRISLVDENNKKEFSFWIKTQEKENQINEKNKFKEYKNILNQENPCKKEENTKQYKYLLNLYYDLSLMYFHCHIAFPLVEIDFKTEEDFDSEKMIDFINRGKNRKVNFVILPSLFSFGSFLQNGKYWVFTFFKNTFKFDDTMNDSLNALLNQENEDIKYIKENLKINVLCINKDNGKYVNIFSNINIPKDIKYEFVIYFFDKIKNHKFHQKPKLNEFQIEKNLEITKYEFILEGETIISSNNIINK